MGRSGWSLVYVQVVLKSAAVPLTALSVAFQCPWALNTLHMLCYQWQRNAPLKNLQKRLSSPFALVSTTKNRSTEGELWNDCHTYLFKMVTAWTSSLSTANEDAIKSSPLCINVCHSVDTVPILSLLGCLSCSNIKFMVFSVCELWCYLMYKFRWGRWRRVVLFNFFQELVVCRIPTEKVQK